MSAPRTSSTDDVRPVCPWQLDADGHVPLTEILKADDDCRWPDGFRGWVVQATVYDDLGHRLDGDYDPKGVYGCQHTETREWRAAHATRRKTTKAKERPMEELHQGEPTMGHAEPVAAETSASLGVEGFDLSKVIPAGGQLSSSAVLLGGLAIAGGVALKVVPAWLKGRADMAAQRLALKAKRLELEQQAKKDEQGGDCASRHAACLAAIAALEERVKLVERQTDGLMGEVASAKDQATKLSLAGNGSDVERVEALEKKVAELSAKVAAS